MLAVTKDHSSATVKTKLITLTLQILANNYFTLYITSHYITFETIYMHCFQILQIYKLTTWTPLQSLKIMFFIIITMAFQLKGSQKPIY